MSIPKALLLFPAIAIGDAPLTYGIIEIGEGRGASFFDALRIHLQDAIAFSKASSDGVVIPMGGKNYITPRYKFLSGTAHWCEFLPRYPDQHPFEDRFHGVEDMETLVGHTADDLLEPNRDIDEILGEETRPAVINFQAWYQNVQSNGWFTGTIEQFAEAVRELYVRTEGSELVLMLPWRLPVTKHVVDKHGTRTEFAPFEQDIEFFFNHDIKHSDHEKLETVSVKLAPFISAFEDAVKSIQ